MIKRNYIFYRPKAEKFLINYLDRFAIGFVIIFPILIVLLGFTVEKAIYVGFCYALLMFPIIVIYRLHHKKFAYQITFDFEKNVVIFDMLRNKGEIRAKNSEINRITINKFITFYVKDKKIKYKCREKKEEEIVELLRRRFKVAVKEV